MASNPDGSDDDPTRALDDFVRRMRPPAPAPAPDLSEIGRSLHAQPAPAPARGGVLRSGQRWSADEVEDVPVVELPRTPPPSSTLPTVDLPAMQAPSAADGAAEAGLAAALHGVRVAAAAQEAVDDRPAWQPDPVALQLRPAPPPARLLAHWQPGAWACAARTVCPGRTEIANTPQGPVVDSVGPQRLLLLWTPRADGGAPGRWPHSAWLLDAAAEPAGLEALALVPDDARVWPLADTSGVDWALGAELVLNHTAGLQPFQIDGLRAFIAAEREAVFARLNDGYRQAAAGGAVQQA